MASNGPKEGPLTIDPGWFQLWDHNEIDQLNVAYKTHEFAPSFLGFGSSGGGEMLAFDDNGCIFMIPFISLDGKEAVLIADSWRDFENSFGK